jgi:predicted ABC-type ATPase
MPLKRRPIFVVLAGPNGAGKSTMTPAVQIGPKIDSDAIARDINPTNPDAAALPAARRAIAELKSYKEQGRSFTYETTLSSNTSLREIEDAKLKGYEVRLYFVALESAIQSAFRVQDRVTTGGHDIPADAIARRFEVTFAHVNEVVAKVDRFELIDNHRGATRSVLLIESGRVIQQDVSQSPRINRAIAELIAALGVQKT